MKSKNPSSQLQLIVSLATAGDREGALAEARKLTDSHVAAEAWRLLSEINANSQRWDAALSDLEIALQHQPGSRPLRLRHALLREQRGDSGGALAELAALESEAADSPELLGHLGRALQYAGETERAEMKVGAALRRWPTDASLHRLFAELRWQRGAGSSAAETLELAIESHPGELKLRLIAADVLRNAGDAPRALTLLERGLELAPNSAAFLTSIGVLLDGLDRPAEALPYLRAAVARTPDSLQARGNLVPTLLRTGAAQEALQLVTELARRLPDDQLLVAWRSTALRVLGDPAHAQLCDYGRLVRTTMLVPPPEFTDIAAFNAAFERMLQPLHRSAHHPLAQSLRGGTQTSRNLPANEPLVAAFLAMIDAPIRDYIARLRDGDRLHPVDRRRRDAYRIAGSWSVRLEPGGFHINHVHPQGWLSSAYYIALPGGSGESRAGWLKFGEPAMPVAGCPPEHFVEPKAGMLVLFPSYFWHGTVPFEDGGRRLTAAFDVIPA
jgi:tetratricopeptide (TPR) repeat protein